MHLEDIKKAVRMLVKALFVPVSWRNRRSLLRTARHNHKIFVNSIAAVETVLRQLEALKSKGFKVKPDLDMAASSFFATHLALDLNSGLMAAVSTSEPERRGFLWRTVALTLYEGLSQYVKYAMPAQYRFIKDRLGDNALLERNRACARRFSRLETECSQYLHAIRNNCIAHREADHHEFSRVRASVNEAKLMNFLTRFYEIEAEARHVFGLAIGQATEGIRTRGVLEFTR